MSDYGHNDIADGIAATLRAQDNAFTEVGATWTDVKCTEFAVTTDSGQRFVVTVRPY